VVALGGGMGLSASLAALRRITGDLTAVVTVADDGGSSGRLRTALGIPAPGDIRKCLVALAPPDSTLARAFEHRFDAGELSGHALGNLLIAGLASATGDFVQALDEAARLLHAQGRVLPTTTTPVTLTADAAAGAIEGQVAVSAAGRISHVELVPPDAEAPAPALHAIKEADQVVIGPGSLFTSVLAAVVVPGIRQALADTAARKVYVCNLRPQIPETAGYDMAAHVEALAAHGIEVDVVLHDPAAMPAGTTQTPHVVAELARPDGAGHDPARLAAALAHLLG
jgi:uncharacterized cofD-like protein